MGHAIDSARDKIECRGRTQQRPIDGEAIVYQSVHAGQFEGNRSTASQSSLRASPVLVFSRVRLPLLTGVRRTARVRPSARLSQSPDILTLPSPKIEVRLSYRRAVPGNNPSHSWDITHAADHNLAGTLQTPSECGILIRAYQGTVSVGTARSARWRPPLCGALKCPISLAVRR